MAVAISIALVFVVVDPIYEALDERSYWTVVTTGAVHQQCAGQSAAPVVSIWLLQMLCLSACTLLMCTLQIKQHAD